MSVSAAIWAWLCARLTGKPEPMFRLLRKQWNADVLVWEGNRPQSRLGTLRPSIWRHLRRDCRNMGPTVYRLERMDGNRWQELTSFNVTDATA